MSFISANPAGSGDAYARLVQSLQFEFGAIDVGALARTILDSGKADFHWDGRVKERYLGQHLSLDDGEEDLARIAIVSFVAGRWNPGICLVDGEGCPSDLLWSRSYEREQVALEAFERTR